MADLCKYVPRIAVKYAYINNNNNISIGERLFLMELPTDCSEIFEMLKPYVTLKVSSMSPFSDHYRNNLSLKNT